MLCLTSRWRQRRQAPCLSFDVSKEMNPKQPTLSAYDFLGYLFPGFAFLVLVDITYLYHIDHEALTYDFLVERYSDFSFSSLFAAVVISYLAGHIISFISSIVVEKYSIWHFGHHKDYLLDTGIENHSYFKASGSNAPFTSRTLRFLIWVMMLPISFYVYLFGKLIGLQKNYVHPFDPLILAAVRKTICLTIKKCGIEDPDKLGTPSHHELDKLALHYVLEHAPVHAAALKNYVVLYGFLRSICLLSLAIFWGIFAHILFDCSITLTVKLWSVFLASLFCLTCFLNYYKFFRRYYEETFYAILALSANEENANKS